MPSRVVATWSGVEDVYITVLIKYIIYIILIFFIKIDVKLRFNMRGTEETKDNDTFYRADKICINLYRNYQECRGLCIIHFLLLAYKSFQATGCFTHVLLWMSFMCLLD